MPMHEQILRKEQDPFHKPEEQAKTEAEQAAAAVHRRAEEEQRREAAAAAAAKEPLAPMVVAHLPGQTGVSDEAMRHLFTHFSEREKKGDLSEEEAQHLSATQTDPRTTSRARSPGGRWERQPGDEFTDSIAADFMPDSQQSAAALDEGPRQPADLGPDAWAGEGGRRKRRGAAARGARKKTKKGEGKP